MAAVFENESLATEARYAPVTSERTVRSDLETTLPKPCKFIHTHTHTHNYFCYFL